MTATGGNDPVAVRVGLPDGGHCLVVDQMGEGEVVVEEIGPVTTPLAK